MIKKKVVDEMVRMYVEDRVSILYIANYLDIAYNTVWRKLHERQALGELKIRPAGGGCYK